MSDDENDAASPAGLGMRIVSGTLTPEELAAITAVMDGVGAEIAEERAATSEPAPSAWSRSQRQLRATHAPGPGAWRSFSG